MIDDSKHLISWTRSHLEWLTWLEKEQKSKVYVTSYEEFGEAYETTGHADLYVLGHLLFDGVKKVRDEHKDIWRKCHVILVGHSIGGLAIKQLILEAELGDKYEEEDLEFSFVKRVKGVFYFSTPNWDSADLTRLLGRSRSRVGAALASLSRVTQRLNHQFMARRRALGIPTAAVFEGERSRVGNFNDFVVSEGSARMDVDIALAINGKDHFSICEISKEEDSRYQFLLQRITMWVGATKAAEYKEKPEKRGEEEPEESTEKPGTSG